MAMQTICPLCQGHGGRRIAVETAVLYITCPVCAGVGLVSLFVALDYVQRSIEAYEIHAAQEIKQANFVLTLFYTASQNSFDPVCN